MRWLLCVIDFYPGDRQNTVSRPCCLCLQSSCQGCQGRKKFGRNIDRGVRGRRRRKTGVTFGRGREKSVRCGQGCHTETQKRHGRAREEDSLRRRIRLTTRKGKEEGINFTEIQDKKAKKQDNSTTSECWKDVDPACEWGGGREGETEENERRKESRGTLVLFWGGEGGGE